MRLALLFVCFCFIFLPAEAQQKHRSSIDSILVSPQLINAGHSSNDKEETFFEIINNSSREVCINNIRASCSCISLKYDANVILSGDRRKVLVELKNATASNYYIYVSVQDKYENKERTFLIKIVGKHNEASSNPPDNNIIIRPNILEFVNVSTGNTSEGTVEIKNQGKKDVFIRHIIEPCSCISVEYDKDIIKPNESQMIKVRFIGRSEPVEFDLRIMLNNSSRPYIVKIKN